MRKLLLVSSSFLIFAADLFIIGAPQAEAAGLTFSASTTASLTNPAETWTIAGSSNASSVQVGTGNVVVAMQNGDSITVSVSNRNFSLAGLSSSAVITRNTLCYLNTGDQQAILTLTATQNETITVTTGACGQYASGRGQGSGPVVTYTTIIAPLVPSSTPTLTPPTPFLPPNPTAADIQSALDILIQQVKLILNNLTAPNVLALIEQVRERLAQVQQALGTPGTISPTSSMIPPAGSYTIALSVGSTGDDVTALQNFLKAQGADIYPEGRVTGYFGLLTKKAVQRFQTKYGIADEGDPGYGFVGPKTRAKINSLLGLFIGI